MNRRNFFLAQKVAETEMDDAFLQVEEAEKNIKTDMFTGPNGFLNAAVTVAQEGAGTLRVDVGTGLGWDKDGFRVSNPNASTFVDFTGDDDPADPRIAAIYLKFLRVESDPRVDGIGGNVNFKSDESFELFKVLGTPAPGPTPPALDPTQGVRIAHVTIPAAAGVILTAGIDTTIQNLQSAFDVERLAGMSSGMDDAMVATVATTPSTANRVALLSDVSSVVTALGYQGEVKILTDRGTPTTSLDIEFCRVIDTTNAQIIKPANNTILDATAIGVVNGLDAGALAVNTWYFIHAIADSNAVNPDGTLLSLSSTSPTLPGTHDLRRLIGAVRTDAGALFINFRQIDNEVFYEQEEQVATGAPNGALTLVSVATRVPPIAERGIFYAYAQQLVAGGDTLRFGDGGQAVAAVITTKFRLTSSSSAISYETGDFKLHVDVTQSVLWAKDANINASELFVRGFVLDNKEG